MNADTLQLRWQTQDAKLDRMLTLNRRLLSALERGRARTALEGVARTLWTQFVVDALAVLGLGAFIGNRASNVVGELRFLVPAVALFVPACAVFASIVWQLLQLRAIDADGPVTVMQRRLERLRGWRVRFARTIVLVASALWMPVYIVGLRAAFGFDVYAWFPLLFVWLNVAVGVAMIPGLLGLLRLCGPWLERFPAIAQFRASFAGAAFVEAREQLARLAAFESEE